jgi:flavin reductase (DIM6/NTAB) family NADH-FMN oxidoreductase RutF
MLGLISTSQTTINLLPTKQCVLNLASDSTGHHINALTGATGTKDVLALKLNLGYHYVKDNFGVAGMTAMKSDLVQPPCIE